MQDSIIYVLCEHEAPCTSAGPVVSSNGIPYMASIEPVCYVITNTPHTLNNFFLTKRPYNACAGRYYQRSRVTKPGVTSKSSNSCSSLLAELAARLRNESSPSNAPKRISQSRLETVLQTSCLRRRVGLHVIAAATKMDHCSPRSVLSACRFAERKLRRELITTTELLLLARLSS